METTTKTSPPRGATAGRQMALATAGIGFLHVLRLLLGFVANPLIANRLALAWQADVYTVAQEIVNSIWLVFEKVLNPAVLPLFAAALGDENEERAWRYASTVLWITLILLLVIAPLAAWQMPFIVNVYSQKAGMEQRLYTVAVARVMLLGLTFLGISSLTYVILNGYKRFFVAALGDTFWKLGIAVAAFYAVRTQLSPLDSLNLLAWGFVAGSVGKLLPHLFGLWKKWRLLHPKIDWSDPLLKKMWLLAVPLILGIVFSQLRDVYLFHIADDPRIAVEGSRTALKYSRLIGTSLIQVFPYALSIGIFPYLADMARKKDRQPLTDTLLGALRVCAFVFIPLTCILISTRFDLLRAVWESGHMTQHDTVVLSLPFVVFSLGLVAFACEMMLGQTFYAMTNAWTPTIIGLATSVLWCILAAVGLHFSVKSTSTMALGIAAIAGAESLSKTIKCILMGIWLRPYLGEIPWKQIGLFLTKVLFASLLCGWLARILAHLLVPNGEIISRMIKLKMLLGVSVAGMCGVILFIILCYFMRVNEAQEMAKFVKRRISKR
jgi:putative peptidoglycan lipid II flippase